MLLLLGFAVLAVCVWMLPVLLMGYPLKFPELSAAMSYSETGVLPSGDGRLSMVIFAFLSSLVSWNAYLVWTLISCVAFAVAFFPWWLAVRRLYDTRVAWFSTMLLAFMPVYFLETIHLNFYSFAFLFLFSAFYFSERYYEKHVLAAHVLAGLCLGLAVATKEAFIVLLPWIFATNAYRMWSDKALIRNSSVLIVSVALGYSALLLPALVQQQLSPTEIIMELSPMSRGSLDALEFYPDLYTYEFDREWHDAKVITERGAESSYLATRDLHRRITFDVDAGGIVDVLISGTWLFVHNVLNYLHLDSVGGAIIWLFVITGMIHMFHTRKILFYWCIGVVISMELIIRFGLHFQRSHIQNIGWVLALFAALGIKRMTDIFASKVERPSSQVLSWMVALVLCVHLLQVDRAVLARQYLRGESVQALSDAELLKEIPEDSLIATHHGGSEGVLSQRKQINFQLPTIERLLEQRKLAEAFDHYGVTHINRYPEELSNRMVKQARIEIVTVAEDEVGTPPPSEWMRYLLYLVR